MLVALDPVEPSVDGVAADPQFARCCRDIAVRFRERLPDGVVIDSVSKAVGQSGSIECLGGFDTIARHVFHDAR